MWRGEVRERAVRTRREPGRGKRRAQAYLNSTLSTASKRCEGKAKSWRSYRVLRPSAGEKCRLGWSQVNVQRAMENARRVTDCGRWPRHPLKGRTSRSSSVPGRAFGAVLTLPAGLLAICGRNVAGYPQPVPAVSPAGALAVAQGRVKQVGHVGVTTAAHDALARRSR